MINIQLDVHLICSLKDYFKTAVVFCARQKNEARTIIKW